MKTLRQKLEKACVKKLSHEKNHQTAPEDFPEKFTFVKNGDCKLTLTPLSEDDYCIDFLRFPKELHREFFDFPKDCVIALMNNTATVKCCVKGAERAEVKVQVKTSLLH